MQLVLFCGFASTDIFKRMIAWVMMSYNGFGFSCDIETITFHKKGDGDAGRVVSNTKEFYKTATTQYPLLKSMKFANK